MVLELTIDENIDILCIAETKIDESFPWAQFVLSCYHKPSLLDISDKQGGLLIYIKSHLPLRPLSIHNIHNDIQVLPFELNLWKENWMFMCICRPPNENNPYVLDNLSLIADHYSSIYNNYIIVDNLSLIADHYSTIYDNYLILGDFNMEPSCATSASLMQLLN